MLNHTQLGRLIPLGMILGATFASMGLTMNELVVVLVYVGIHRATKKRRRH